MTEEEEKSRSRDRALEYALIFNFIIHGLGLLAMALLLLPMLPGGSTTSDSARIHAIADSPWLFRLGWLPWQVCALADLLLAIAMVRVRWLPRLASVFVLIATAIAVVPDQYAQAIWITRGVDLAREVVSGAQSEAAYLAFEREIFPLTAGWAALFYTAAALGWTWCFARGKTWSRVLTILSIPLWITMIIAVAGPLLPVSIRPSSTFVSTSNGLAFIQLQLWLGLVTEEVLRRARPYEAHGRLARWRHPKRGIVYRALDLFANSRFFGALLEPLPELEMRSEIENVVYVNYLVEADVLLPLVPPRLELQRLGPSGRYALFTFLTYQHKHFGFALLGPLRKLLTPSPIQTNWRIHVRDPRTKHEGIYFITNAITHLMPALGARMITEGMPMHVLHRASLVRSKDDDSGGSSINITLDPGEGSAPDAELRLAPPRANAKKDPELTGAWAACFKSYRELLAYCVPQDRAMSSQPLKNRVSRQEINLGIPLEVCEPVEGEVTSRAVDALLRGVPDEQKKPLCFRVANVAFTFSVEAHDPSA